MIVKHEPDEILGFLKDASNLPGGSAEEVCFPESEEEIVAFLRENTARGRRITVAGAGTGLAGGRIPFGGAVLSLERMNRILEIDTENRTARVQPGVILGDLQRETESHDLLYPPDPTERSCFVGGTVATNASGARTFKYGPTRDWILSLRIVLSTGERLILKRGENFANGNELTLRTEEGREITLELPGYEMPAIKHAAGYFARPGMDAIDLFIGSEGTLGVFTEIELRLIPLPERIFSGVVFFPNEESTISFVDEARRVSRGSRAAGDTNGIDARALEFVDANALEFIRAAYPNIPHAANGGAIWFEQEVNDENEEGLLAAWYDLMLRNDALADDSWFAVSLEDQRRLRDFRHAVPSTAYEFISENGLTKMGTDMAVPDERFHELFSFYRSRFAEHGLQNITWGHIGNSHLHANIFARPEETERARSVYKSFIEKALSLGGTISAEHGVGKLKRPYLITMFGEGGVEGMRKIKRALDPAGILGAGTMFEEECRFYSPLERGPLPASGAEP